MYLLRRGCVQCPVETPNCSCDKGATCRITVQTCDRCAEAICVGGSSGTGHGGAIAGGVVGGLAGLALVIGLLFWWRYGRNRRYKTKMYSASTYSPEKVHSVGHGSHSASITSVNTAQARGSNIIPIAYIPGVTMFSGSGNRVSRGETIRNSIATSNYSASLPDFVMAIHGQPSLVDVNSGPSGPHAHADPNAKNWSYGQLLSGQPGVSPFAADHGEALASSGHLMVAIPEEEGDDGHDPRPRGSYGFPASNRASRARSTAGSLRSDRYSRATSMGEYLMDLPEEAYLYHGGGHDVDNKAQAQAHGPR